MTAPPPDSRHDHPDGHAQEPAWLHPHVHEPNPAPPSADPSFTLARLDGTTAPNTTAIQVADLATLPQQHARDCYIVSTGHGTSGPFHFSGVTLPDLFAAHAIDTWTHADVISADGFGTRVYHTELPTITRPILLALTCNGEPLTREQGLVRLIVPHEKDDALRQVKWVVRIEVHTT